MARQTSAGPHLITTQPHLHTCRKCGKPIMMATVHGTDRKIGTAILSRLGEFEALMAGRVSYLLRHDELVARSPEQIVAPIQPYPVLADHTCGEIPLSHLDVGWQQTAIATVVRACGGTIVSNSFEDPNAIPPF